MPMIRNKFNRVKESQEVERVIVFTQYPDGNYSKQTGWKTMETGRNTFYSSVFFEEITT